MRIQKSIVGVTLVFLLGAALAPQVAGCSTEPDASGTGGSGASGAGGPGGGGAGAGTNTGAGGDGVGGFGQGASAGSGGLGGEDACVATSAEATLVKKPVDIVFVIDNSGSMGNNIESVQNNINDNFASIIGASGIDYRVIMISQHGNLGEESICVQAPLSATNCMPVPNEPAPNPPLFFHYSVPISSHNSFCQALASYDGTLPDEFALGPTGWKEWLRKEAFKVFVEVTDDGVACSLNGVDYDDNDQVDDGQTTAEKLDTAILALDPEQFGDSTKRNYVWHSIVGLAENTPVTAAYQPVDAIVTGVCDTAVASGTGYQFLSQTTGGLRFPICAFDYFDVVFQEIAKGVIEGAKVECEFPVPDPPAGETLDLATVVVQYTPGDGGAAQGFKQVAGPAACQPASFYIEEGLIKLCPDACTTVQADGTAQLEILFGCEPDIQ